MELSDPRRYLANAREILRKDAKKKDGRYQDKKYVRKAGHTAYVGVLEAIKEWMNATNYKVKGRKDVYKYREFLAKYNKKLLHSFNDAYEILHLSMGYDGIQDAVVVNRGLQLAKEIIEKIEHILSKK